MIFHIAVCSPDAGLRSGLERQCMEFFARRADACIVEHLPDTDALLRKDGEGVRYDLYLLELSGSATPVGLAAAGELRRRGRRAPLAFVARTTAHAYSAYKVDALQYLLYPWFMVVLFLVSGACARYALDKRSAKAFLAERTRKLLVPSTLGLLVLGWAQGYFNMAFSGAFTNIPAGVPAPLPYAGIEYLECTHHIVHFHLTSGEDVPTLSLRVPFSAVAQPLLADGRFLQPHRSYVVNLAEADLLSAGELRMRSGARISIPRGREGAVRDAFQQWVQQQKYSLK